MERLRSQFHPVVAYGDSGTPRRRSGGCVGRLGAGRSGCHRTSGKCAQLGRCGRHGRARAPGQDCGRPRFAHGCRTNINSNRRKVHANDSLDPATTDLTLLSGPTSVTVWTSRSRPSRAHCATRCVPSSRRRRRRDTYGAWRSTTRRGSRPSCGGASSSSDGRGCPCRSSTADWVSDSSTRWLYRRRWAGRCSPAPTSPPRSSRPSRRMRSGSTTGSWD